MYTLPFDICKSSSVSAFKKSVKTYYKGAILQGNITGGKRPRKYGRGHIWKAYFLLQGDNFDHLRLFLLHEYDLKKLHYFSKGRLLYTCKLKVFENNGNLVQLRDFLACTLIFLAVFLKY